MVALYLASLLFGGVLVGTSVLFGGIKSLAADGAGELDIDSAAEADVIGDVELEGAELDADADFGDTTLSVDPADVAIWMPFFSLRFYTFGTTAFGMIGLALSFLVQSQLLTAAVAGLGGLGIGWSTAWLFQKLARRPVSGETSTQRYVGHEARVVLPIRPPKQGIVALQTYQGRLDLTAESQDDQALDVGETVLIASIQGGVANVTRLLPSASTTDEPAAH